jgi:putative transposase
MAEHIQRLWYPVNEKRVRRLLRERDLEAVYPKPKLSICHPDHKVFPYLIRGVGITRCNQVCSTDITYIPLHQGFVYLTAIMDWNSRSVRMWAPSRTLEVAFCMQALTELLER